MKIQEGERIKYGYGWAWRNYNELSDTAFIIPFNFIFRWARELYIFLAKNRRTYRDEIYQNGFKAGKKRSDLEWSNAVGKAILMERESNSK